ncbi:MAG: response regulator [Nitrospinae bacterium]|nr:response regulator [Nitrospinota bacterium]
MKKILIVDDNESIRNILNISLNNNCNLSIIEATSGPDAVEIALKEAPDLIFMDIMMPGNYDGIQATKRIKQNIKTKDIKVILLTALGREIDIENGFKSGADGYFVKPFSPSELVGKVDELLGNN